MLSKANRIDNSEMVEGFYIPPNPDMEDGIVLFKQTDMCLDTSYVDVYTETVRIDPSTLKHSFNNGESWHTEDEIKEALETNIKDTKSCENCKHFYEQESLSHNEFQDCGLFYVETRTIVNVEKFFCSKHEPK